VLITRGAECVKRTTWWIALFPERTYKGCLFRLLDPFSIGSNEGVLDVVCEKLTNIVELGHSQVRFFLAWSSDSSLWVYRHGLKMARYQLALIGFLCILTHTLLGSLSADAIGCSSPECFKTQSVEVNEVVWTTDAKCVFDQCRLEDSPTLRALTTSCPRERCSEYQLVSSSEEEFSRRPFAIVIPQADSRVIQAIILYLNGVVDLFIVQAKTNSTRTVADIYEYGKLQHSGIDIVRAVKRGSFGGVRAIEEGPIQKPSEVLKRRLVLHEGKVKEAKRPLKECLRQIKENSVGLREEDMDEYIRQMMRTCLLFAEDDYEGGDDEDNGSEITSIRAVEDARDELWEKALQLGLVPDGPLRSLNASQYLREIWREIEHDVGRDNLFWLAISWVPVFDELHEGLGHGDRYEVLLLELVHVERFSEFPDVSAVISTKSGSDSMRVRHRRLLALSACDDDSLESVLRCVRASVPNLYLFNRVVWGMGFVGDERYSQIEADWNGDPAYYSSGEMPPKYEDKEMMQKAARNEPGEVYKERDEI